MLARIVVSLFVLASSAFADNQTSTISPIYPGSDLPFEIEINQADFSLPQGLQSFAWATYKGKWLLLAGRTNGMHTFNNDNNNFPPSQQNQVIFVVDPQNKTVYTKSLTDPTSGLTQEQIDTLSVTASQYYQKGKKLYITGGYGVISSTGEFSTKDTLTAIDIPGLIHWVVEPDESETAVEHIRQVSDPLFQITGGDMFEGEDNLVLLIFGQNFSGAYFHSTVNGIYSKQIRRFRIIDDGKRLSFKEYPSLPFEPDPNYRRRDLNTVPVVRSICGKKKYGFVSYSGVFTLTDGIWTVPVEINLKGDSFMADPLDPNTFKQGMNNYASAHFGVYSKKHKNMYTIMLGGISFGFFINGNFQTDSEFPFVNDCTAIKIDECGNFSQYILSGTYPVILSTQSNPGNQLLFGASSDFIPACKPKKFSNGIFKLDVIERPTLMGYVVGGIQSTLPNTNVASDSAASPYIFEVWLNPNCPE